MKAEGSTLDEVADEVLEEVLPLSGREYTDSSVSEYLSRGQRYEEALTNLDRYIDSSLLAGLNTVTIIHGIGTGAIRNGVQQYLKRNRHVKSYSYAPANQGGTGATIVHLQ